MPECARTVGHLMYKINVCAEWSRVDKRTIKIAAIAVVCIDVGIRYPQIGQKTGVHLVPARSFINR